MLWKWVIFPLLCISFFGGNYKKRQELAWCYYLHDSSHLAVMMTKWLIPGPQKLNVDHICVSSIYKVSIGQMCGLSLIQPKQDKAYVRQNSQLLHNGYMGERGYVLGSHG